MVTIIYRVLDNDMKANKAIHPKLEGKGWGNCDFNTLEEALEYALNWLGPYKDAIPNCIETNVKYEYSGAGDTIEIRRIEK